MGVYMNPLETEQDVLEYSCWLQNKNLHFLNTFLQNFKRDIGREKPLYEKHLLRIELVEKEIEQRLKCIY